MSVEEARFSAFTRAAIAKGTQSLEEFTILFDEFHPEAASRRAFAKRKKERELRKAQKDRAALKV